jgi:PKD repeat protein
LTSGESALWEIVFIADPGSHVITNTAWVTSAVADLQPEDNVSAITIAATLPPTATTGPNQTVYVDDPVTLDGTASTDPDGDLPLTYGWQQTGGPAVTLDDPTATQPTFTAPSTPSVLTFTLWVTDALGMPCNQPDMVVITVVDRAISGPAAFNDSPTVLGNPTGLWATVVTGTNVIYTWDLGDGTPGSGQTISHTYPAEGWYTAIVTASNSANSLSATTLISITELPTKTIYLPIVYQNYAFAPDLVVDRIIAASNSIQVVISNQGDAPVENRFENEFWVDVYINPDRAPASVNETWQIVGSHGIVWGVTQAALPLNAGEILTLTVTSAGGTHYYAGESDPLWPLPAGSTLYAQVDSAHENTTYGAIYENHEIMGTPYENNILGPSTSAASASGLALPPPGQDRFVPSIHLPPRP